jgi:hypothetical protein
MPLLEADDFSYQFYSHPQNPNSLVMVSIPVRVLTVLLHDIVLYSRVLEENEMML